MKHLYLYLYLYTTLLMPFAAPAQEEIQTDRPDQTENTSTVPAGRFQMENGFQHLQAGHKATEMTLPAALLKYGINDKLEVRVNAEFDYNKTGDSLANGLAPLKVGFKVNLWKEKGLLPEASFITQAELPGVASKDFRATYLAPQLQLLFHNTVTDAIEIGYNIDAEWDGQSAEPQFEYTFSPEFKLTNKLKGFVEAFGYLPQQGHPDHWADGGLMWLLSKNVQLDLAGGYEISAHNHYHKFFETLGFSFRI